jgi:hypothetical protein
MRAVLSISALAFSNRCRAGQRDRPRYRNINRLGGKGTQLAPIDANDDECAANRGRSPGYRPSLFAVYSAFTPPVAVGVIMAVRISGGSFAGTVIETFKLGAVCTLLPFFLVAYPNALKFPNLAGETMIAAGLLIVSTVMLSGSVYGTFLGRLSRVQRGYMLLGPLASLVYYSLRQAWLAWLPLALALSFLLYRLASSRRSAEVNFRAPT